jgi:hypothetical protein
MTTEVSKVNVYAVIDNNAVEVSKINVYAVIDIALGSTIAYITQAQVEVWGQGAQGGNPNACATQIQVEVWGASFIVGNLSVIITQAQTEVWTTTANVIPSHMQPYAIVLA